MTLTSLSATELRDRIGRGDVTAHAVMGATLDRIEQVNPSINAIVSLRSRDTLLAEAAAADLVPKQQRGPLHGMPMAVKDLVATKGVRTTWGSPFFADHVPENDDILAARIKAAGAIIIGKTNTPEFGLGSHSFNPVHGTTVNPYDPSRSAGGSSGGAAAALAARMVALADGSDMMGSLRNPAAFCNVYGFRPSWGLVPQDADGDRYFSTMSTDGPMARSVEDMALLLEVLAGPNPETPFGRTAESYRNLLTCNPAGMRIGWLGDWGGAYPTEAGILTLCESALGVFEELGAVVEHVAPPFPAEDLWQSWITLRAMLSAGSLFALADDPDRRAKMKPEVLWEIDSGRKLSAAEAHAASCIRSSWYKVAARLFDRYDALVLPSAQVWPFPAEWRWPQEIAGRKMDTYHRWMEVVIPAGLIGLPALALPAGFGPGGLPMGVQLIGRDGADARILALGQAYHQATDWPARRPPVLPGAPIQGDP